MPSQNFCKPPMWCRTEALHAAQIPAASAPTNRVIRACLPVFQSNSALLITAISAMELGNLIKGREFLIMQQKLHYEELCYYPGELPGVFGFFLSRFYCFGQSV